MNHIKKIYFLTGLFACICQLAANNPDSLIASQPPCIENFTSNLEKLPKLWVVNNSILNNTEVNQPPKTAPLEEQLKGHLEAMNCIVTPLYNSQVKAFVDVYIHQKRSETAIMLGLGQYYSSVFERELLKLNLPAGLKYLPFAGSSNNPLLNGRDGASGIWQLTYSTAKFYKLRIDSYIDERKDVEKSSQAAASYLKDLFFVYQDWELAIAAYHCGPANVNKAIRRAGGLKGFWDIYPFLPASSRDCIPAYIATVYIATNYQAHGLKPPAKIDFSFFADTVIVDKPLAFKQLSDILQLPVAQIREMNPEFTKDYIPAEFEPFSLKLPKDKGLLFETLRDSILIAKDTMDVMPVSNPKAVQTATKKVPLVATTGEKHIYTVKSGDVLGAIAMRYHVSVSDIKAWNDLIGSRIYPNQKLVIYTNKAPSESQPNTPKPAPATTNSNDQYVTYTVKSGDNFWIIAKKFPGVSANDIMQLNNISDPKSLRPGMVLKIKKK